MENTTIDIEIIWRKIHGELSSSEEAQLQDWVEASLENSTRYDKAVAYYQAKTNGKAVQHLTDPSALNKLKLQLKFKAEENHTKWYYAAAASLILLISSVFIWQEFTSTSPQEEVAIIQNNFDTNKAYLITSDGDRLELDAQDEMSIEDEDASISFKGKSMRYESKDNLGNKLSYNTLVIPRGGEFSLVLSDGTKIWLNSESTLTYPVAFSNDERRLTLTGEAYFDVAKDADRPFTLISQQQTITVLGTSFNVTSYPSDEAIITTLVEGKVIINLENGPSESLFPGEQTTISKKSGAISKEEVDVYTYISWKDGLYNFEGQPLSVILNTLSRWYDIDVIFKNESLKNKKFTGEIKRYEDIAQFLEMLETTGSVKFELNEKVVTVK